MQNSELIDRLVDAYNAHDADAFAALFAVDAQAFEHAGVLAQDGRDAIRAFYTERFAKAPRLRTDVRYRVDLGNRIVDHEYVTPGDPAEAFHCIAIYEIRDGEIVRVDLVRAHG